MWAVYIFFLLGEIITYHQAPMGPSPYSLVFLVQHYYY